MKQMLSRHHRLAAIVLYGCLGYLLAPVLNGNASWNWPLVTAGILGLGYWLWLLWRFVKGKR